MNPPSSSSFSSTAAHILADLSLSEREKALSARYMTERDGMLEMFMAWTEQDQTDFCKHLLQRMCHHQHGQIDQFLGPMLQRDFIGLLPTGLAENVLHLLDAKSLFASELVSKHWQRVIANGMLWRKFIERKVRLDSLWSGLANKRGWKKYLFISKDAATYQILTAGGVSPVDADKLRRLKSTDKFDPLELQHKFYLGLYPQITKDIQQIEQNWREGRHRLERINCESENSKGVYCLQYDDEKIVSGLRDNTIKIWKRPSLQCVQTLTGHTGSVLCLQYDEQIIASGSSDATVRIWDVHTGQQLNTLIHHCEAVLHLRFQDGMLVTCSKDRSIAVWDMASPHEIDIRRVLVGHRAAVNVVDFDQRYIVSASGDRTIKVWSASTCEFVRTLNGHKRGIACLQYRDRLIVSGSSDFSIRLWDIECGNCLRVLEGHEELVRCIRFDSKRIVSGAYDGKIKIWDLQAALDPRTPPNTLCLKTLSEHTGRVFRLQFDEFQIVSSSHDDTILIWDFLNVGHQQQQNGAGANAGNVPNGIGAHGAGVGGGQPPVAALAAAAVPQALAQLQQQQLAQQMHQQQQPQLPMLNGPMVAGEPQFLLAAPLMAPAAALPPAPLGGAVPAVQPAQQQPVQQLPQFHFQPLQAAQEQLEAMEMGEEEEQEVGAVQAVQQPLQQEQPAALYFPAEEEGEEGGE